MRFLRSALVCPALILSACSSSSEAKNDDPNRGDGGGAAVAAPYLAPAPDDCITSVEPGHQTLNCDGLSFELTVPDTCLTKACGFITDVHGFGMNAELQNAHTKLRDLGGAAGYIVMQPTAPGALGSSMWSSTNDAQVFSIMQRVLSVWHVDPKRIHFDGYSMGSWMTWRFVCNHADILASAATISGGARSGGESCAFSGSEMPSREIPVFYTHGRNDGLVNFSTAITERDALLAAWQMGDPESLASASDYQWDRYKNANGTVFEFLQHDWQCGYVLGSTALKGHCFPGSDGIVGCGASNPITWGELVLQFFIDHPMH